MSNNHLVIAAAFALLLAVPTGALALADADTTNGVELTPSSDYATVEDHELALDFDRLNADATTSTDEVFEITVTDKSVDKVWIDHDLDGVTFYANGDRSAEIGPNNPLHLSPGETATIGVSINTREAPTGTETFTVVVETSDDDESAEPTDPAPLEVTNATVDRTAIEAGERVTASATVTNPHDETAAGTVDFAVGGAVVADRYVELAPGEERTVTFEWLFERSGEYAVSVGGESAGTVSVSDRAGFSVGERELASPLTAAVAPPAGVGLVLLIGAAKDRRRS